MSLSSESTARGLESQAWEMYLKVIARAIYYPADQLWQVPNSFNQQLIVVENPNASNVSPVMHHGKGHASDCFADSAQWAYTKTYTKK
jgi:hypothetical protein